MIAHIVNIASDMAYQGIATARDIDRAVKLGLGYPRGPSSSWTKSGGSDASACCKNSWASTVILAIGPVRG